MTTGRDAFFQRVRQALSAGSRPGQASTIAPRGSIGYQGAGPDLAARFCEEFTVAGGHAYLVPDRETAVAKVLELVGTRSASHILVGRGVFLDTLDLAQYLRALGRTVVAVDSLSPGTSLDALFAAEIGIGGVAYLIAETGTVVLMAQPGEPRSLSLLPPVHIAVAERAQLLPDLFDLFEPEVWKKRQGPPSCLTLITGPSKTGDIELRLVTGVHGPGEIHVVVVGT